MNVETKLPGHSNVKCPKCGRWMRARASSTTDLYYYEEVVCLYCGVYERLKVPIGEYNPRSDREIVLGEVVKSESSESAGQRIYGRRGRARVARRVKREKS